jgi:hypothetical protein
MKGKKSGRSRIRTRKPTAPPVKVFRDRTRDPHRKRKYKKPADDE